MIKRIKSANAEAWRALRRGYLGGSDAAAVLGLNPWQSPYSLWAEKTGAAPAFQGNLATQLGRYLEDFVASRFEAETGKRVRRCRLSLVNDAFPFAIANIDRLVVGEDAGLELKTASPFLASAFRDADCPPLYRAQCLHYLAVTERARWYLAVLIGSSDFRIYTVERDENELRRLMEAERAFWEDHVLARVPPAPDGSPATAEALRALFPESREGPEADLSAADDSLRDYLALGEQISALEAERERRANTVKAMLGDAALGLSEHYRVSWKSRETRSFNARLFREQNPGLDLGPYYRSSTSRVFRVTPLESAAAAMSASAEAGS